MKLETVEEKVLERTIPKRIEVKSRIVFIKPLEITTANVIIIINTIAKSSAKEIISINSQS